MKGNEEPPFKVVWDRVKVKKTLRSAPKNVQVRFTALVRALAWSGPLQPGWPNYSPLSGNTYHCHLTYSWVACWRHDGDSVVIEVYYVGSRERAPY